MTEFYERCYEEFGPPDPMDILKERDENDLSLYFEENANFVRDRSRDGEEE